MHDGLHDDSQVTAVHSGQGPVADKYFPIKPRIFLLPMATNAQECDATKLIKDTSDG